MRHRLQARRHAGSCEESELSEVLKECRRAALLSGLVTPDYRLLKANNLKMSAWTQSTLASLAMHESSTAAVITLFTCMGGLSCLSRDAHAMWKETMCNETKTNSSPLQAKNKDLQSDATV